MFTRPYRAPVLLVVLAALCVPCPVLARHRGEAQLQARLADDASPAVAPSSRGGAERSAAASGGGRAAASRDSGAAAREAGTRPYLLQPGDVIEISVWKEPDLDKDVLVRSDGGISFPLAGDFDVAGKSAADVRTALKAKLTEYIPGAVVSVAVKQINGNQVFVVGKVARPGAYRFNEPIDVMQALSLAGGATTFADVDGIRILRRGADGTQRVFDFAYSDVLRGRSLPQNIVLRSGDTVVVP